MNLFDGNDGFGFRLDYEGSFDVEFCVVWHDKNSSAGVLSDCLDFVGAIEKHDYSLVDLRNWSNSGGRGAVKVWRSPLGRVISSLPAWRKIRSAGSPP